MKWDRGEEREERKGDGDEDFGNVLFVWGGGNRTYMETMVFCVIARFEIFFFFSFLGNLVGLVGGIGTRVQHVRHYDLC